ncbi:MAG TPA: archaemetzincin family Zn-dependent metalloprotease [Anaeromyxobacter sp.]|nr:archaemetzincin family Zn-dependent metalloprotease [Anaeromyxobacter sp.]
MGPIGIGWIGEGALESSLIGHVVKHVSRAFSAEVREVKAPGTPRHAFDPRRKQHASGEILRWLLPLAPEGGKVLGVTDRDLFIPILTYVFGEAQLGGAAAVVSTARLLDELEPAPPRVLRERLAKEAVHELGHCFGLRHCPTPGCVMGRSSNVRDVDAKGPGLCPDCRARLYGR